MKQIFTILALAAIVTTPVMAQKKTATPPAQDKSLPEDLATGLGIRRTATAGVVVGDLPAGFPGDIRLPARGRIAGGISRGRNAATAVIAVNSDPSTARSTMDERLRRDGWTVRPVPTANLARTGAQPAPSERPIDTFCRPGGALQVTTIPRDANMTLLRLDFSPPTAQTGCPETPARGAGTGVGRAGRGVNNATATADTVVGTGEPARDRGRASAVAGNASERLNNPGAPGSNLIPRFDVPAGSRITGNTFNRGDNDVVSRAVVDSNLSPGELIAQFGNQLNTAGWTAGARSGGGDAAVQTWTLTQNGITWIGTLVVSGVPNSRRRQLLFSVMQAQQ